MAFAHARQLKGRPRLKGCMILVASATAHVGRVSPRPQDRGCSCTLLSQELLREAKASGRTGRWLPMILRSRRDAPYLARFARPPP
jgi:hypothetical protein